MKKIFTAAIFFALLLSLPGAFNQAFAGAPLVPADICFLIDTSASMTDDINEVKARIVDFNTAMVNAGIDAQYCLVEFGGTSGNGATSGTATLFVDVTDFTTFNTPGPAPSFSQTSASGGGIEEGSTAVIEALSQATFRQGSVINLILLTDEDDDSAVGDFNQANTDLGTKNALFNYIGVPGVGNTDARYGVLAANHGGSAFSIVSFRANPGPFFNNFIDTKVQEILEMAPGVIGGDILPINNVSLILAGLQLSGMWITPLVAGAAGLAAFYLKTRKN